MIKRELVEVVLTSNMIEYYTNKGYSLPIKVRTNIQVWSTDLPEKSGAIITRVCDKCGEEHTMKRAKYTPICRKCNSGSMSKARADEALTTCPDCGCKISYKAKRCKDCFGKANSGENNPMYGKKLDLNHPIVIRNKTISENPELHHNYKDGKCIDGRSSNKFRIWSELVKEAYNNKCDCCNYDRKVALKAHHLYAYEANKDIALYIENGVALCGNCHEEFHKENGWGDNTPEQYYKFKEAYNG